MAYKDLHHFVETLERLDDLHRVTVAVDPVLEIAEITDRVSKTPGGKALLFERVNGSRFPVVTNIFGSMRRICASFEVEEPLELTRRMEELLSGCRADTIDSSLLGDFLPRVATSAPCQDIIEDPVDLGSIPALKNWSDDGGSTCGGRFLTLPLVFTRDPESGASNCGMYRVELFDASTCGIHWYPGSGGEGHHGKYLASGRPTPVAIVLGSDPAVIMSAAMPLPETVDEMQFAGFLRSNSVDLVRCRTNDLMVPANAEVVIEGYIEPGETRQGGSFGNHTGYYLSAGQVPLLRVACITRKIDAIIPATIVGQPPMEDCFMAKAIERLMLPVSRLMLPEIIEMNLPIEGIFHGAAVVSIRKSDAGQARQVMETLWSKGWLAGSRLLVIVDDDVDPHNISQSAWRVFNNVDWRRDIAIEGDAPGRAAAGPFGGKLGIDATRKLASEMTGDRPADISRDALVQQIVSERWRDYGL